jgi:hypothetical protein
VTGPRDVVAELRAAFDQSFADAPPESPPPLVELVAIRVGESPCALPLADVASIHAFPRVEPLPGAPPGLQGVAGFRDVVVAVWDLGALLGHPTTEPPRWIARLKQAPGVGVSFAALEGHLRIPAAEAHLLRSDGRARALVDIPALLAGLPTRSPVRTPEER